LLQPGRPKSTCMMTANFFVNVPIAPPKPPDFISAEETACASKNITLENLDNCQEWLGQFQKVEEHWQIQAKSNGRWQIWKYFPEQPR
jgi:hypothetical protein